MGYIKYSLYLLFFKSKPCNMEKKHFLRTRYELICSQNFQLRIKLCIQISYICKVNNALKAAKTIIDNFYIRVCRFSIHIINYHRECKIMSTCISENNHQIKGENFSINFNSKWHFIFSFFFCSHTNLNMSFIILATRRYIFSGNHS